MPVKSLDDLQNKITWSFKRPSGQGEMRYGTYGGRFYLQYMASGVPTSALYPPRQISEVDYKAITKGATPLI